MKKKIIVIGSGWAGSSFIKHIDDSKFEIEVVSKNKNFTYTPLLANSIFNGHNLEYDIIKDKKINFIKDEVNDISFNDNSIILKNKELKYDYLVLAHGSKINTFNIKGIEDNCLLLKNMEDLGKIKEKIGNLPYNSKIAVIGCGLTGSEIIGNLIDTKKFNIIAIDGANLPLPMFNSSISYYTVNLWKRHNVNLNFNKFVSKIDGKNIYLGKDIISYDLAFWCGGVKISELSEKINKKLNLSCKFGIPVNDYLNVKNTSNVYAIGDCGFNSNPPTAQVSYQEGKYLANNFNNNFKNKNKFYFSNKGQICYIGDKESVYQNKYFSSTGKVVGYFNKFLHIYNAINYSQSLDFLKNLFK